MATEPIKLSLTINGEEFIAPPPKMKMLKRVMDFNMRYQAEEIDLNTPDGIDAFFQLIVDIIGNDDLTIEKLEELEISEFSQVFTLQRVNEWINQFFAQKKMQETQEVSTMRERQKSNTKS